MDSPTLMSIKQMIDAAFGDPNANVVNHKLIHAVLIILARQIRLLERRVEVDLGPLHDTASTASINVTEVKMYANAPKKKKQKKTTESTKAAGAAKGAATGAAAGTAAGTSAAAEAGGSKSSSKTTSSTLSDRSSMPNLPQKYLTLLEKIEQQREKELRVIHQRADSREENKTRPTPMASMDAVEKQYEKLLIVQKVPKGKKGGAIDEGSRGPRLSIVTQEEFEKLAEAVKHLQEQYLPAGSAGFPDNSQLMDELRKGASLTDAMAALQLSARLEAAEKTLEQMISLVTDLAAKTPLTTEMKSQKPDKDAETKTLVVFGEDDAVSRVSVASKKMDPSAAKSKKSLGQKSFAVSAPVESDTKARESQKEKEKDWITAEELDTVMQELYDEFMKIVNDNTSKSNSNANNALKIANKLEKKLDESLNLGSRMADMEKLVYDYAEHVNVLDTGISSQMTSYQEQLTQMQHDLEVGIETMQEALANTGGDTTAVTELNNNFTNLQIDFDVATMRQKELSEIQNALNFDLQALWKQIEILRDEKSNRDEVADALRDKAGIAALNGLVSRPEFDAVRGDFEKRIGAAYDKFNNQEVTWQKAIDELLRVLNEKADYVQIVSLQESIAKYLEKFDNKIKAMFEIVGEPRAAAVSRKLHRDAACLSCKTPAHMDVEEHKLGPSFPAMHSSRPSTDTEAKSKPSEDGDHHGLCYPGFPIPHPIDPRSHVCRRYCGGSHTMLNNTISRVPPGMIINPVSASQQGKTVVGSDGKAYVGDQVLKPCKACLLPPEPPIPKEAEPAPDIILDQKSSGMTPPDYRMSTLTGTMDQFSAQGVDEVSITPPAPIDMDN